MRLDDVEIYSQTTPKTTRLILVDKQISNMGDMMGDGQVTDSFGFRVAEYSSWDGMWTIVDYAWAVCHVDPNDADSPVDVLCVTYTRTASDHEGEIAVAYEEYEYDWEARPLLLSQQSTIQDAVDCANETLAFIKSLSSE